MSDSTRTKSTIMGIVLLWLLAVGVVFTLGAMLPAWPRWLELPWSGFDDFAVTPDGKVLVYTSFFSRLLVYDLEGGFLVSLPGLRSRGMHRIAVDAQGRIYVAGTSQMCMLEAAQIDGKLLCKFGPADLQGWQLDEAGVPQPVTRPIADEEIKDGIVQNGEILASRSTRRRKDFTLGKELVVDRVGDRLYVHDIHASGEETRRLSTPWYLYWAKFPFPAWLSFVAAALCSRWGSASKGRAYYDPSTLSGGAPADQSATTERELRSALKKRLWRVADYLKPWWRFW